MKITVFALLVAIALLVCWALAEWYYNGWKMRKRRIILLAVLAFGLEVICYNLFLKLR